MRWLIWTAVSTLVMLLAMTEVSASIRTPEISTKGSTSATAFRARSLSSEYNSLEKRSLRDKSSSLITESEERSIAESLANKVVNRLFKTLYKKEMTPLTFRAKMMGRDNFLVGDYKVWWDKARATGTIPKWKFQRSKSYT
ncbi:secreted RxLR effector peptide protein, putative [Phytophthora infestans T30-4]|uniref:RxLR effector protein CRE2 n=2 Tax=Phytophthora infestans TaxID=4787 RepID=CRE2_PHYIT|nr:secreted RxLR effector peptide protein, putative [Phytophthora infestans T30-4]D0N0R8.1 RecName: Full=RxLR effector protein CRE2; AltName: Full=Core RXLR effector 2; Flags: Precursor [Phytophthora infestans T30-4]EEY67231.1 secreted RxLR effector peptide protein, putative [Phytophthora infestans T30-4]KAF4150011.1 hypothetical protein GN958_ATG00804 [Phytophthora infestans]|eukprot:XP_002905879.1 secreted RxLR effector peptide protein, putative [Phytophthora infestans T30-4]